MKTKFLIPAVAVVALALGALPVEAQHGGSGGHGGGGGHSGGGGHDGGGARAEAAVPRGGGASAATGGPRGVAVPRGSVPGPYYGGRFSGGYGFGYALGAPYYAFRPRLGLGFGLWLGYPVGYPYWDFPDPYVYGYPYYGPGYYYGSGYQGQVSGYAGSGYAAPAYGTPSQGATSGSGATQPADPNTVTAQPGAGEPSQGQAAQAQYGGLSFEITPSNAGLLVDNVYVGTVSQFTPTTQPLTLTPGRHHVEMRAEGYESLTLDVNVAPGQVLPYQGTLQRR